MFQLLLKYNIIKNKRTCSMYSDDLIIEKFSLSDEALFQERLKKINIPPDCDFLQTNFSEFKILFKRIFILLKMKTRSFKKKAVQKVIGYCIVYKLENFNDHSVMTFRMITQIPADIINNYSTVIADFLITGTYKRKGIGKDFALKIIYNYLKDEKISLKADGEGLKFWDKVGFCFANNSDEFMYLPQD